MTDSTRPKLSVSKRAPGQPPEQRPRAVQPKAPKRYAEADAALKAAFAEIDRAP